MDSKILFFVLVIELLKSNASSANGNSVYNTFIINQIILVLCKVSDADTLKTYLMTKTKKVNVLKYFLYYFFVECELC
jgi:hypothetical protein